MNRPLLWLDDLRCPIEDSENRVPEKFKDSKILWARNYKEFEHYLLTYKIGAISFDHDLHDEHYTPQELWNDYDASMKYQEAKKIFYTEPTGEDCAKWLVNNMFRLDIIPEFYLHTANPVGAYWIKNVLQNYLTECTIIDPFEFKRSGCKIEIDTYKK
jgi:hypothetical protein